MKKKQTNLLNFWKINILSISNIYTPFESIEFILYDNETGDFIGKALTTLESISDQQSHTKTFELTTREIQVCFGFLNLFFNYLYVFKKG